MSTPKDSKEEPEAMTTEERSKQVANGFRAVADHAKSVSERVGEYANWLDNNKPTDVVLDLQVELLQSLHSRLQ
jgi:hypothetical protein